VSAGLAIYDTMQFIKPDVSTFAWVAARWARCCWPAAPGKRYCLPNSKIMIHQPSAGFQGQASDIDIHARDVMETKQRLNAILAKHTAKPSSASSRQRPGQFHDRGNRPRLRFGRFHARETQRVAVKA